MAKTESKQEHVYQIKITLKGSKPPIWRRFQVTGDTTLQKLHGIIQIVMGWENSHLHQFIIGGKEFGEPDSEFDDFGPGTFNEKKFKLNNVVKKEKQRFEYQYDFGDDWRHDILIEKILPLDPSIKYPVVLDGKRACPPEDCGGVWGYEDILEIIGNPKHEQYEEIMDWLGGEFDPEEFQVDQVNKYLGHPRRL